MLASTLRNASYYKDPYRASTVALLQGGGTNGSTTITDSSPLAANWTAGGGAQISTGTSKFGGSSIYLPGTANTRLTASAAMSNFTFGTGDFTVEFWFKITTSVLYSAFLDTRPVGVTVGTYPVIYWSSTTVLSYHNNGANRISTGALSTGTWYHLAVSRSSGTTRMFVNGSSVGTYADTTNYLCNQMVIGDGSALPGYVINGYIDDYRITKGVGRYVGAFTPPTSQLPAM